MPEVVGNLHLHTTASDGTASHAAVAVAAARAGLDFIVYTDHNIAVEGIEGWYRDPAQDRAVLCLMGQEVNDQNLTPERNHLLCHFVTTDLTDVAADPQQLIDTVLDRGGLCFLAHPLERPGYGQAVHIYPWVNWEVTGFTGLELWNAMTDAKWRMRSMWRGLLGAYFPQWVLSAPFPEVLAQWDQLLSQGQKVVAIGGADAHGMAFSLRCQWPNFKFTIGVRGTNPPGTSFSMELLSRTVYPYDYLFRAVSTHILLSAPLDESPQTAKTQLYQALKAGRCFVSNDLLAPSRGFTFMASSGGQPALMGDSLTLQSEAVLRATSPHPARLRLLKDGQPVLEKTGQLLEWRTREPGVYRVEAYRRYWLQERGWVFTNPIYLTPA